jgi:branched-chain amino acid transport system substrate-binding protein
MMTGFKSTFKGQILGEELTRWPDQLDFSAELSKARAAKPDAMYVFYPGGPGVQFMTQYAQSGMKGQIPLYSGFTIDDLSLPRLKDLAVGNPSAMMWVSDMPNDANKKFVADFRAKYKTTPSFYGADTYDSVALLNSAVTAVKGDLTNKEGMRKEMEKADFKSVRGNFKFNNNHLPIQNFYLEEARQDADSSYSLHTISLIVKDVQDAYHTQCPMK